MRVDLGAAGMLRARQRAVEQGATGVGVDLDELWAAFSAFSAFAALVEVAEVAEVKVETHEHAFRPGIEAAMARAQALRPGRRAGR